MLPTLFNYEGQKVRTVIASGEPWFIAKDVCDILEIQNSRDAVGRLDEDEKSTVVLTDGTPGNPNQTIVNEPGLYSLILGSRKPEAKTFKRWITHEVIPSIRKTGAYTVRPQSVEDLIILQAQSMKEIRLTQQQQAVAITDHEFKIADIDQKVTHQITLTTAEQKRVQGAVNSRARSLGIPDAYRQIYGSLKKQFNVPSYRDLKRSDLSKAFTFIQSWSPGRNYRM